MSLHKVQLLLPHRGEVFANNITLLKLLTSPNVIPGTYKAHTKCTHFPQSVSLNIPPKIKYLKLKSYTYYCKKNNLQTKIGT